MYIAEASYKFNKRAKKDAFGGMLAAMVGA